MTACFKESIYLEITRCKYKMSTFKSNITLILLLISLLGSSHASAENAKVKIGKFSEGKELIIFDDFENTVKANHSDICNFDTASYVPAYIRINSNKIQPVCWQPARGDGMGFVVPLGEQIDFYEKNIKFKNATLDLDRKKIR